MRCRAASVGARRHGVRRAAVACAPKRSSLRVDGAVQHYLTTPVFSCESPPTRCRCRRSRASCRRWPVIRCSPRSRCKLNGPLDRLGIDMNVRSSAGQLTGQLTADVLAPGQSAAGDVTVRNLDLGPIVKNPAQKTDLTAKASVDLDRRRVREGRHDPRQRHRRRAAGGGQRLPGGQHRGQRADRSGPRDRERPSIGVRRVGEGEWTCDDPSRHTAARLRPARRPA